MLQGMLEAVSVVADTFGPRGKTIAYQKGTNTTLTKDGITVLKNLKFSDELKDIGIKFVKEASDKANFHNGDGSSTTAILTGALCKSMNELIDKGVDINLIRESLNEVKDFVLEQLKSYKEDIDSEEAIENVALVSSNGDKELAKLITEAFTSIGDKGLVSYADSQSVTGESCVKIQNGLELSKGYISSKCVNTSNDQCIMEDVKVAIFKDPVEDLEKIKMFVQLMHNYNTMVIAPDYSQEVAAFYMNSAAMDKNVFIRTPGYSIDSINRANEDLAAVFNTPIIGETIQFEEFSPDKAGTAEEITVTKNSTVIVGPSTDKAKLDEYINTLEGLITHQDATHGLTQEEITDIKSRIARMTGGIATIYVGALTSQELSERKDRADDAVNAVRNALRSGFVVGGGTAFYRIATSKEYEKFAKKVIPAKRLVYDAFMNSIETPLKILVKSAGKSIESVAIELSKKKKYGFNAKTGYVEDIASKGIIDPYSVVENCLIYSTNMAGKFVSIADAIISDVKNLSINAIDDVVDPGRNVFSDLM